jgi:hypothetical protein
MNRLGLFVLLVVIGMTNTAFAASTAVFPVNGTNLQPGEMDVIGVMIADAYAKHSRQSVLGPAATQKAAEASNGNLPSAARTLGVSQYLQIKALRLTTKTSIHVVLYNADGSRVHQVSATATTLDDMEPVSDRIARSLINRTSLDETRNVDNVTLTESEGKNRTFVEKVMGVKTSVLWPVDFAHYYDPSVSLQFDGRLEAKHYFLEFGVGFLLPPNFDDSKNRAEIGGLISEIGASYYLSSTSTSPYIGAGLLPRVFFLDRGAYSYGHRSKVSANLALYAQAGLMFLRESSSRIYIDLRIGQNVIPLDFSCDDDGSYGGECSDSLKGTYFPMELTLLAGIGW